MLEVNQQPGLCSQPALGKWGVNIVGAPDCRGRPPPALALRLRFCAEPPVLVFLRHREGNFVQEPEINVRTSRAVRGAGWGAERPPWAQDHRSRQLIPLHPGIWKDQRLKTDSQVLNEALSDAGTSTDAGVGALHYN